jgi:hypothetical protein
MPMGHTVGISEKYFESEPACGDIRFKYGKALLNLVSSNELCARTFSSRGLDVKRKKMYAMQPGIILPNVYFFYSFFFFFF